MPNPTPERRSSGTQITVAQTIAGLIAQFVVGLIIIAASLGMIYYALEKKDDHSLLWVGVVGMLVGASCFPSILPIFQKIYITVLPNGLPMFGGKRTDDPQPPPPGV